MKKSKLKKTSYLTRKFKFIPKFSLKISSYEKLAMKSKFELPRFYDVIIRNSVFELGFLTREFQISLSCQTDSSLYSFTALKVVII